MIDDDEYIFGNEYIFDGGEYNLDNIIHAPTVTKRMVLYHVF